MLRRQKHVLSQSTTPFACTLYRGCKMSCDVIISGILGGFVAGQDGITWWTRPDEIFACSWWHLPSWRSSLGFANWSSCGFSSVTGCVHVEMSLWYTFHSTPQTHLGAKSWTQTCSSQTCRVHPGYPGQIPKYPANKFVFPGFRGTYRIFWPPPIYMEEAHLTWRYPDAKIWVCASCSCLRHMREIGVQCGKIAVSTGKPCNFGAQNGSFLPIFFSFWIALLFWIPCLFCFKEFLVFFWAIFPSQEFWGFNKINDPCFLGGFLCLFQIEKKKTRKGRSGFGKRHFCMHDTHHFFIFWPTTFAIFADFCGSRSKTPCFCG